MDVNQTRFHLVYGEAEWYSASAIDSPSGDPLFDWEPDQGTLTLHAQLFILPKKSGSVALDPVNRRGAGRDRYGNWYWVEVSQTELRFLGANGSAQHFWQSGDEALECPVSGSFFEVNAPVSLDLVFSGLAVTSDHYLVVGMKQPKGLLLFDLHAGDVEVGDGADGVGAGGEDAESFV